MPLLHTFSFEELDEKIVGRARDVAALFDSASVAQETLPFTTKFCNTNRLSRCTWTHMQGQLLAGMHSNLGMTSRMSLEGVIPRFLH